MVSMVSIVSIVPCLLTALYCPVSPSRHPHLFPPLSPSHPHLSLPLYALGCFRQRRRMGAITRSCTMGATTLSRIMSLSLSRLMSLSLSRIMSLSLSRLLTFKDAPHRHDPLALTLCFDRWRWRWWIKAARHQGSKASRQQPRGLPTNKHTQS